MSKTLDLIKSSGKNNLQQDFKFKDLATEFEKHNKIEQWKLALFKKIDENRFSK